MTIYTVHKRPGEAPEKALLVPDGFSFEAFALTVVWAAWNRMWLVAAVLLAIDAAIAVAGYRFGLADIVIALINLAVALIFGFEARDLQRRSLAAAGRGAIAITTGKRREDAELRYFLSQPAAVSTPAPIAVRPAGPPHDPLGLFGNV